MSWGESPNGNPPYGGQEPPPGVVPMPPISAPVSRGILSPSPLGLDFRGAGAIPWPQTYSHDLTTGAPQKLFRYLLDSLVKFGFAAILTVEPSITGQAIGDTGTTEGYVLGEKNLHDVKTPFELLRIIGAVLLLVGALTTIYGTYRLLAVPSAGIEWNLAWLIAGIVVLVIGNTLAKSHAFESQLLYVHLKGEAYRSGLAVGTRMPAEMADSSRLSVISELRLSVYGSEITSRNFQGRRTITRSLSGTQIQSDFQLVVNDLASNVMPKVLLQKSWEQVRHEYTSPIREVKHQVVVKCGYCGALNEESAVKCVSCGGPLK